MVVGAGPAGLQAAIAAARNGHRVTVLREGGPGRRAGPAGRHRPQPGRAGRPGAQPAHRVPAARRARSSCGVGVWPGLVDEKRPDVGDRGHRRRAGPPVVGARRRRAGDRRAATSSTARHPPEARRPATVVVVIDEIGFHHATSVAELLADRGCQVEIVTNGMVVGQDLGVTLDMEGWWMRAEAKGIVQSTDLVPMGLEGRTLHLLHHPTGHMQDRTPDWVVLAVPATPGRLAVPGAQGSAARSSSGSATAWPRAGPTPRSSTASGSGRRCDRASVPVRDGELPAGAPRRSPSAGAGPCSSGSGAAASAARSWLGLATEVRLWEAGPFRPGTWAATLAPLLEPTRRSSCCRPRPTAATWRRDSRTPSGRPLLAGAARGTRGPAPRWPGGAGSPSRTSSSANGFVATLQPGVRGVDRQEATRHPPWRNSMSAPPTRSPTGSPTPRRSRYSRPIRPRWTWPRRRASWPAGPAWTRPSGSCSSPRSRRRSAGRSAPPASSPIAGWLGHERQIGTTGVVVDPRLYVAFGISGAVQHTSGLGQPEHIVSVNTDPHCPMMQLADLAVVSDANAVLDELLAGAAPDPDDGRCLTSTSSSWAAARPEPARR